MSKHSAKRRSPSTNQGNSPERTQLVVAILALIGAFILAVGTFAGPVIASLIQSAERLSTQTPTPSPTPLPAKIMAGEDIRNGCISVDNWTPYAEQINYFKTNMPLTPIPQVECWFLYDWGIYIEDNRLVFRGGDSLGVGQYGISTAITHDTIVEFTLLIDQLPPDNRIRIGIIPALSPAPEMDGFFLVAWGSLSESFLYLSGFDKGEESNYGHASLPLNELRVRFEVVRARSTVFINDEPVNSEPANVPFSTPYIWIGYETSSLGEDLQAAISEFSIQQK